MGLGTGTAEDKLPCLPHHLSLLKGWGFRLCSPLLPLISHRSLACADYAAAHEQHDVTALQPTLSGKGGQAHLWAETVHANGNSLKMNLADGALQ